MRASKKGHLFSRGDRIADHALDPVEQAAFADNIMLRALSLMGSQRLAVEIQTDRLLAAAVAWMQTHRGCAHTAAALRERAAQIDPSPCPAIPPGASPTSGNDHDR